MASFVRVAPELNIILEPMESVIASEREDLVLFSLEAISERVDVLEEIADDLMHALCPSGPLLSALRGRDKAAYRGALFTGGFYGFMIGLLVCFLLAILIYYKHLLGGL